MPLNFGDLAVKPLCIGLIVDLVERCLVKAKCSGELAQILRLWLAVEADGHERPQIDLFFQTPWSGVDQHVNIDGLGQKIIHNGILFRIRLTQILHQLLLF